MSWRSLIGNSRHLSGFVDGVFGFDDVWMFWWDWGRKAEAFL
jgi:hypothetical protein